MNKNDLWFRLAAALGFLAVALGAFGAHALKDVLTANATESVWNTAVQYHFLHALAIAILTLHPRAPKRAGICFLAGIVLFSGSLYLLALFSWKWLGPVTPLGGVAFLAGWTWIALGRWTSSKQNSV